MTLERFMELVKHIAEEDPCVDQIKELCEDPRCIEALAMSAYERDAECLHESFHDVGLGQSDELGPPNDE